MPVTVHPAPANGTSLKTSQRFPAAVGPVYNGNGPEASGTRTTGTTLDQLVAGGPLVAAEDITIGEFSVNIATAAAGGVYRVGIWTVDDPDDPFAWTINTKYATLLLDAGTVDASTTGPKTISPAGLVVPAGSWFVVGGVAQGVVSQPTIATGAAWSPMGGGNTSGGVIGQGGWLRQDGVSGALGDLVPNNTLLHIGHGAGFKRSA